MQAHAEGVRPLHEVVAEEFRQSGWTQKAFAERLGLKSQQTFSNWLKGDGLRVEWIPAIEDALDLRRGFILRKAGYVADPVTTEDVIRGDHAIANSFEREVVIDAYRSALKRSSSAAGGARTSATTRKRRTK